MTRGTPMLLLVLAGTTACSVGSERGGASAGREKSGVSVTLASPVGYVKVGDRRIAWHPSPGISRYELTLMDSTETPLYVAATADTQVMVPDSLRYSLTNNYRWYVTAYRDTDSTAWRSPVAVFRLEGEGRRMPPRPE